MNSKLASERRTGIMTISFQFVGTLVLKLPQGYPKTNPTQFTDVIDVSKVKK